MVPTHLILYTLVIVHQCDGQSFDNYHSFTFTTTNNNDGSGSSVFQAFPSSDTVDTSSGQWEMTTNNENRYWALQISLSADQWGFKSIMPSFMRITLYGTHTIETTNEDNQLIMAFQNGNSQYWSTVIFLDSKTNAQGEPKTHAMGPECDTSQSPLAASNLASGNAKTLADQDNGERVQTNVGSVDDKWYPEEDFIEWPLVFEIENHPMENIVYLHHIQNSYTQSCGFSDTFDAAQDINIYLKGDDDGTYLRFQSFMIEVWSNNTESPTFNPTTAPSPAPSLAPSSSPTSAPSSAPTDVPSDAPTPAPTNDPSKAPSSAPSSSPTSAPSSAPIMDPTSSPTTNPPSSSPSASPSQTPSASPSNTPTSSPSKTPSQSPTTTKSTSNPSTSPTTAEPTSNPSLNPTTAQPTTNPSSTPSSSPSASNPSTNPSVTPTSIPSSNPTAAPSAVTIGPSSNPTLTIPTTDTPSVSPTTAVPTSNPSSYPSTPPTTARPTSQSPTLLNITTANPSTAPSTAEPTSSPSETSSDTLSQFSTTAKPTVNPSISPNTNASSSITTEPTMEPTAEPTFVPSETPTIFITTTTVVIEETFGTEDICNDGRMRFSQFEEIGNEKVAYCYDGLDDDGYPKYIASLKDGDATIYYSNDIEVAEGASGYVIYYTDQVVAYCVEETNPIKCSKKWVVVNVNNIFVKDEDMTTFNCECDDAIDDATILSVVLTAIICVIGILL